MWPDNFHKMMSMMRIWLNKMCANFFNACRGIQDQEISIDHDDTIAFRKKKADVVRKLIKMLLSGVQEALV